jgi:DNA topoisomerase-1
MKYCEISKLSASGRAGKWWGDLEKKKGQKWQTMKHNGVLFPPAYEPLPSSVKILHKGKPLKLDAKNTNNVFNVTAEEGAVFFAMKMEQDDRLSAKNPKRHKSVDDKKFTENFWKDWKVILGKDSPIKSLSEVDFKPIQKYIATRSEEKKSNRKTLTKEEKAEEKKEKERLKDLYGYAIVDGVKIALGSYVIQPPGLYMGHGNHPLRGRIKKRTSPSDVTLNVSKDSVPKCKNHGKDCTWGNIVENKDVTWIASWRHPITDEVNYVWLKREESHWVCADDMVKFDKARNLAKNIDKVRSGYTKNLTSSSSRKRQLATAVYLLDKLAIRPGMDKDESKESDTLGLTTLKCENVKFGSDSQITVDFTGKSSIRFVKTFKVEPEVYSNLKNSCKKPSSQLFPDVDANTLNEYLKGFLPDLTAKVFRTYKASSILEKELNSEIPDVDVPTHEKKIVYDRVAIEVAKALNHKKMGGSDERVQKLKEKLVELKAKKKDAKTDKQKASVDKSILLAQAKLEEAEENIATSTSKVNYLDPRITVAWAKKAQLPIEKLYNKTQLQKFIWAMDSPSDWKF